MDLHKNYLIKFHYEQSHLSNCVKKHSLVSILHDAGPF